MQGRGGGSGAPAPLQALDKVLGKRKRTEDAAGAPPPLAPPSLRGGDVEAELALDALKRRAKVARILAFKAAGLPAPLRLLYEPFARQREATAFLDALTLQYWAATGGGSSGGSGAAPGGLPFKLYAQETGAQGQRRFLVAHTDKMWEVCCTADPAARHFYEIARADTPCHLYFDLEYKRGAHTVDALPSGGGGAIPIGTRVLNAGVDPDALTALLLHRLARWLDSLFGIRIGARHVLTLESSVPSKFSRHIVVRLPGGALFRDVGHVGEVVLQLLEALELERSLEEEAGEGEGSSKEKGDTPPPVSSLWVETPRLASPLTLSSTGGADAPEPPSPQQQAPTGPLVREPFVDIGVYTRNRTMRTYLSCKWGKVAQLLPLPSCSYGGLAPPGSPRALALDLPNANPSTYAYWLAAIKGNSESSEINRGVAAPSLGGASTQGTVLWQPSWGAAPAPSVPAEAAAAAAAAASQPSNETNKPTETLLEASSYAVAVGSKAWERRVWDAALITDARAPLWLHRLAGTGMDGKAPEEGAFPARHEAQLGLPLPTTLEEIDVPALKARVLTLAGGIGAEPQLWDEAARTCKAWQWAPPMHPVTGARLLYCWGGDDCGAPSRPGLRQGGRGRAGAAAAGGSAGSGGASYAKAALSAAPSSPTDTTRPLAVPKPAVVLVRGAPGSPPPFPALAAYVCSLAAGPIPAAAGVSSSAPPAALAALGRSEDAALWAAADPSRITVRGWSGTQAEVSVPGPQGEPPRTATVFTSVTYDIAGSRYCNNAGRQHRRNGVKWTVALPGGVAYQSCWDPDCRGYRSAGVHVPSHLLPSQL